MKKPPIVCIVGKSNSGKTTFVEELIPELKGRGYRVGIIKHSVHGFSIDVEGKDSWRYTQAGANTVILSSLNMFAFLKQVEEEIPLDEIIDSYLKDVDIVVAEGFKKEDKLKIEVFRSEVSEKPLCALNSSEKPDKLIAIISDTVTDLSVPHFKMSDVSGVADFLEEKFLKY